MKEPVRNETLLLATLAGALAWVLTVTLKAAITGWPN
jgi:hypothetical protein